MIVSHTSKGGIRMNPIRIAIVGAGVWGDTHAAIYKEHPSVNPVAICDKNVQKAQVLAEKYGLSKVYADIDELLSDGDFEAVSIVTPDHLHADIAV